MAKVEQSVRSRTKKISNVGKTSAAAPCPQCNSTYHGGEKFRKIAQAVALWAGSPIAFAFAIALIGVWAALGPVFKYSDTWQLVINTGTTIITFLMVFLIQNSQNRESRIVQLKIDELIYATKAARNQMVDLEDIADAELDRLHAEFRKIHVHAESQLNAIERHRSNKPQAR